MARSHHRHKKHHQMPHHPATARPRRKVAATVFIIFLALFGLGIGYFAYGLVTALAGAVVGALIGYLIGHNLDKMANNR